MIVKSDEFDSRMRAFEKSNDELLRPEIYVVCRIDGRNFSTLTRKTLKLKPYHLGFAKEMRKTVRHLMDCGFPTAFAYTQSDEISILMDRNKKPSFAGKLRKYNSLLAAEASAMMSISLGQIANQTITFDCRTIQLPTKESVFDYFAWRRADSERNCLNMWTHHVLVQDGLTTTQAQSKMDQKSTQWKQEVLFQHGMNFNNIEEWQKRGIGIFWEQYEKEGFNPKTNQRVLALRKRLKEVVLPKEREEFNILLNPLL